MISVSCEEGRAGRSWSGHVATRSATTHKVQIQSFNVWDLHTATQAERGTGAKRQKGSGKQQRRRGRREVVVVEVVVVVVVFECP